MPSILAWLPCGICPAFAIFPVAKGPPKAYLGAPRMGVGNKTAKRPFSRIDRQQEHHGRRNSEILLGRHRQGSSRVRRHSSLGMAGRRFRNRGYSRDELTFLPHKRNFGKRRGLPRLFLWSDGCGVAGGVGEVGHREAPPYKTAQTSRKMCDMLIPSLSREPSSLVPVRIRSVQNRHRPVEFAYDGADDGRAAVSRRNPG